MSELNGEISKSIIIVKDFNIHISISHENQKKSKNVKDLNIMNQLHLTDLYRALFPTTTEYMFSSSVYGMFTKLTIC